MRIPSLLVFAALSLPLCAQPAAAPQATDNESLVSITTDTTANSSVRVILKYDTQQLSFDVRQRSADANGKRKVFGWKDGFLFVRDDCQVSDESKRPWRCAVDHVYTLVDVKDGKRLAHLGDVHAGEDCIDEAKIGCALYQGVFTDIYDRLENHAFANRADAPAPLIEMRVKSGELIVDLDETWGRNQERFTAGERCLSAAITERASACVDGISPRRAYLFNATLATYAKREEALNRTRGYARNALCDRESEDACSEILRISALMLASIRPGEKPRARNTGNTGNGAVTTAKK